MEECKILIPKRLEKEYKPREYKELEKEYYISGGLLLLLTLISGRALIKSILQGVGVIGSLIMFAILVTSTLILSLNFDKYVIDNNVKKKIFKKLEVLKY